MSKSFSFKNKYNSSHKDKRNKKKINFKNNPANLIDAAPVKSYSPFEDSIKYHESFAN